MKIKTLTSNQSRVANNHPFYLLNQLIIMTQATIRIFGNMIYLDFFNSSEVYSIKGFDTLRKAKNYARKFNITLVDKMSNKIKEFEYND